MGKSKRQETCWHTFSELAGTKRVCDVCGLDWQICWPEDFTIHTRIKEGKYDKSKLKGPMWVLCLKCATSNSILHDDICSHCGESLQESDKVYREAEDKARKQRCALDKEFALDALRHVGYENHPHRFLIYNFCKDEYPSDLVSIVEKLEDIKALLGKMKENASK